MDTTAQRMRWWPLDLNALTRIIILAVACAVLLDTSTRFVVDVATRQLGGLRIHLIRALSTLVIVLTIWWPMPAWLLWLGVAMFSQYQTMTAVAWMLLGLRVAATGSWRLNLVVLVSAVAWEAQCRVRYLDFGPVEAVVTSVIAAALMMALGLAARGVITRRRANTEAVVALELQSEQEREAELGVLARELHDGLAHELSIITLQAMAARAGEPAAQRAALAKVLDSSESAMAELHSLVTLLRDDSSDPWVDLADPTHFVAQMVENLAARGMTLSATVDSDVDATTGHVRQTVLRVLKESATNALRHAPAGAVVHLDVSATDELIEIEMVNPLGGVPSALSTGWGVLGLRERLSLIGGRFEAGADEGEWRVNATIPRIGG